MFASRPLRRSRPVCRLPVVAAMLAAVLLSAAGCSSDGDQSPSGSGGPATPVTVGSLSELADRLGCTGLAAATDIAEPTVQAQGTCTFAGGTATLFSFDTAGELESWSDSTVRPPGVAAILFGGTWAISFPTRDAGQAAQRRLGGRLV
ncbi:MAG TPA: hypothetical protein VMU51_21545 [Mycobacteriales bacterium]|nr:hypothetical protein [Mycobacteriales bacterium]